MKKFTLALMVAAIMLFAVSPLFAEGMMFGVKGGLNLANLTGDDVKDSSMKTGIIGGAFMCYNITEIFAVQPELLFTMKGAKAKDEDGDVTWKVNYIEIPVLFKANLPTEGKMKPFLCAGPGIGFLLSSKASDGTEVDWKDSTKSTNIGIIAGAGVAYQMENGALSFEARYEVGLQTIGKSTDDVSGTEPDIKTSDISFMVGYGFAF